MANEKNLIKIQSTNRARELGSKGGKASGEARRKRKTLRENMNLILSLDVTDTVDFNILSAMGIPLKEINNATLLTAALFLKAKSGDVAACKEVRDLSGETDESKLDKLDELLREFKNATQ